MSYYQTTLYNSRLVHLSAGGLEWPGSTLASGVWIEYTGVVYSVYDLTIVSGMVENIGPDPGSAQNHSLLVSGREKVILIFGSESNRRAQVYSMQVYCGCQSDGLVCNWVLWVLWVLLGDHCEV